MTPPTGADPDDFPELIRRDGVELPPPADLDEMVAQIRAAMTRMPSTSATTTVVKELADDINDALPEHSARQIGSTLLTTSRALNSLTNLTEYYRDPHAITVLNMLALVGARLYAGWPE